MDVRYSDLLSAQSAPENLQTAIKTFNPLYTYITQFRTIVLDVACPDMGMVLYGFVVAFVTLGVGTLVF